VLLAFGKEFVLQTFGFLIVFDGTNDACQRTGAGVQDPITLLRRGGPPVTPIMRRLIGVPPDAGIHTQIAQRLQPFERRTFPIGRQLIRVYQLRPNRQNLAGLAFIRVPTDRSLPLRLDDGLLFPAENGSAT
jgi:hypothetical protein